MNARTWLETLVGFDTTSRNSNLALIETVRDWLKGQGVDAWLAHNPEPVSYTHLTLPTILLV